MLTVPKGWDRGTTSRICKLAASTGVASKPAGWCRCPARWRRCPRCARGSRPRRRCRQTGPPHPACIIKCPMKLESASCWSPKPTRYRPWQAARGAASAAPFEALLDTDAQASALLTAYTGQQDALLAERIPFSPWARRRRRRPRTPRAPAAARAPPPAPRIAPPARAGTRHAAASRQTCRVWRRQCRLQATDLPNQSVKPLQHSPERDVTAVAKTLKWVARMQCMQDPLGTPPICLQNRWKQVQQYNDNHCT